MSQENKVKTGMSPAHMAVSITLALLTLIAAASILARLGDTGIGVRKAAFGKLPAVGRTAESAAQGMPASLDMRMGAPGMALYPAFKYDYAWTGGDFPTFGEAMPVYRRQAGLTTTDQAKALAAKFGFFGKPEAEEPFEPMGKPSAPTEPGQAELIVEEQIEPPADRDAAAARNQTVWRFFNRGTGERLELDGTGGRFNYFVEGGFESAEKSGTSLPPHEQAKKLARDFLADKGLLPEGATGPYVSEAGAVVSAVVLPDGAPAPEPAPEQPEPSQLEILFGRKLGDFDVVQFSGEPSRDVAVVIIGKGGKILEASGELPAELEKASYPLKSTAEAFDEIKQGKYGGFPAIMGEPMPLGAETMIAPAPLPGDDGSATEPPKVEERLIKVEFDRVEAGYLFTVDGEGNGYYQPAYVFSGRTVDPSGDSTDYRTAVPAVAEEFVR